MLRLHYILIKNDISLYSVADLLNMQRSSFMYKLKKVKDFTIEELEIIKRYLVDLNIIDNNFDIGEFLDECKD